MRKGKTTTTITTIDLGTIDYIWGICGSGITLWSEERIYCPRCTAILRQDPSWTGCANWFVVETIRGVPSSPSIQEAS